ncbi:MAG: gamma-glutamylcyclotransferase [Pseudomonadota bacterium]
MAATGDLWVFGYGSLIWQPGFAYAERLRGRINGYRRAFCMASVHYRGTEEAPGLVLALDAAERAVCNGLCYRVMAEEAADVRAYLRARELVTDAYREIESPVETEDGRQVTAVTYIVDPAHSQYRGTLSLEEQAMIIARSHGRAGPNDEYLFRTVESLRGLDLSDPVLEALATLVSDHGAEAENRP